METPKKMTKKSKKKTIYKMPPEKIKELRKEILSQKKENKKNLPGRTKGKKLEQQILEKVNKGLKEEIGKLSRRLIHLERRFIQQIQVLSNHRVYRMEQQGNFEPIWDEKNNPRCQWIDKGGVCLHQKCNWYKKQCIFAGWYADCKYNKSMLDTEKDEVWLKTPTKRKVKKKYETK